MTDEMDYQPPMKAGAVWRIPEPEPEPEPVPHTTVVSREEAALVVDMAKAEILHGARRAEMKDVTPNNEPRWLRDAPVRRSDKGKINPTMDNATVVIAFDPRLKDAFAYDEIRREVMVMRPLQLLGDDAYARCPRIFSDRDRRAVMAHLQRTCMPGITESAVIDGVKRDAEARPFHPLRNYLDVCAMEWDRKERLPVLFPQYFSTDDNEYTRAIGQMMMIAAVKRAIEPGCQCDYAVVLEGVQGLRKSSALAVLAGDEFFLDNLPRLDQKDASQMLRGKWIVEIAELSTMRKSEVEEVKAYLTRREEKYRPPYSRMEVVEPRTCIFVGTTNSTDEGYLVDDENRRFWPVRVGEIDLEGLKRDRDQLWAEAVVKHRGAFPSYPSREFERRVIRPEQTARKVTDPWEVPIARWLETCCSVPAVTRITSNKVATEALEIKDADFDPAKAKRIGAVLKKLGWSSARSNGSNYWVRSSA